MAEGGAFDDRLKTAGLVLGLATTALSLFVAVKTQLIAASTGEIEARMKAAALQSTEQDALRRTAENSVRVAVQWNVMNANEFARGLDEGTLRLQWSDETLQQQLAGAAQDWKRHNRLMGRGADQGLLLRQIVTLRLMNLGAVPASELRLEAHVIDFDTAGAGTPAGFYGELARRVEGRTPQVFRLGTLMEAAMASQRLTTELTVPVAQAVGSSRYVGRVLLPVRLLWRDERQGKDGALAIDLADPQLANRLKGGDLGRSSGG